MRGIKRDDRARIPYSGKSQVAIGSFRNAVSATLEKQLKPLSSADPESLVRGGSHLITFFFVLFFLVDEGIGVQISL